MSVAGSTPPATISRDCSISRDCAGMVMTRDEFDAVEDWEIGFRYELMGGVLIVNPSPASPHNGINDYLGGLLFVYEQQDSTASFNGTLFEAYVTTGTHTRRCVDRAVWTGLHRDPDPDRDIPTIVVEIVSPGKRARLRDFEEKRDEYLSIGVREYWIIDRFDRTMTVYRSEGETSTKNDYRGSDVYSTELLPGFALDLERMFAAGEKWEKRKS